MSVIRLASAAKHYKELPHQLAAWNALEEALTPKQLQDFADLYRVATEPKRERFQAWFPVLVQADPQRDVWGVDSAVRGPSFCGTAPMRHGHGVG
jgi:hypothetical protein